MTQLALRLLGSLFLGLALMACTPENSLTESDSVEGVSWEGFVDEFIETYFEAHPTFAVVQGRHEYDGVLPDWSREGIEKEVLRLQDMRARAEAFDQDVLSEEQGFQRDYLISRVNHDLFWIDKAQWPFKNPAFYFGWMLDGLDPAPYVTLTYAPATERLKAVTIYLNNIPLAISQIRANLAPPLPRSYINYGIASFGGLAEYYGQEMVEAFAGVEDTQLQAAFSKALAPAVEAMNGMRNWLQEELVHATEDFALGADLFEEMLRATEGVDTDLATLEAIARADLDRNTRALEQTCKAYAPGEPIDACFTKMTENRAEGGVVQAAQAQLSTLKSFVQEQDLATVIQGEEALVREAPPYARSNSAYISIPGPYEQGQPSIYYIAPPDPSWPPEVQRAFVPGKADLLFTSVHEVWPGHFHNFLHAKRSKDIFGRIFVGYAFGEGWAHYTEEMMWEAGLANGDLEVHIGQLSNALLRDARFLAAIGLHTQGMSVVQAEQLFMEEGFQSEGTARQQAARGTYDPAYLNYTVGKLLIRQLREDWTRQRGGRKAWKDFHDQFLSYGGPPIPLVRARMMGTEPEAVFWSGEAGTSD